MSSATDGPHDQPEPAVPAPVKLQPLCIALTTFRCQVPHRAPNPAGRSHAGKTKFINKKTALNFEVVHR